MMTSSLTRAYRTRAMQFTLDARGDVNLVRAYSAGEIRVGERIVRSNCLIGAHTLIEPWGPDSVDDLALEHMAAVFDLEPQLALLGTGSTHVNPKPGLRGAFNARGIGLEAMTLGAACRTFNVLVQEERRVVAMLFVR
jgi:uncharacterized protein